MRVDKALSELWDLRQSDDEGLVETSLIAINTIKRLQKECEDKRYLSEENAKLHGRISILEQAISAIVNIDTAFITGEGESEYTEKQALEKIDEIVQPLWMEIVRP